MSTKQQRKLASAQMAATLEESAEQESSDLAEGSLMRGGGGGLLLGTRRRGRASLDLVDQAAPGSANGAEGGGASARELRDLTAEVREMRAEMEGLHEAIAKLTAAVDARQ